MTTPTSKLHPSSPLEKYDLEQRLEKIDANSFKNHISYTRKKITNFKDENHKSKKNCKKYETENTILESVDTIVFIGIKSTSKTLSITGIGLIVLPISPRNARALSIANKVLQKIILKKYNKNRKQYEKDHQTNKTYDKLYPKSLQDNVFYINE